MNELTHLGCLRLVGIPDMRERPIPFLVRQRLTVIEGLLEEHLVSALIDVVRVTDGQGRLPLILGAACKRSTELLRGFTRLVNERNGQSALPVLRAHLDTAMRLHALWLIDDIEEYFVALGDGRVRRLKSRSGEQLNDSVLHRELSSRYPGLSADYQFLSGVVHLSTYAIAAPIDSHDEEGYGLRLDPCDWSDAGVCAASIAFSMYSCAIAHMFSVIAAAAQTGSLQRAFVQPDDLFERVPMPVSLDAIRCHDLG